MLTAEVIKKLKSVVGREYVITDDNELIVYECDGFTKEKYKPEAVVFPADAEEVSEAVKILYNEKIPFTARGAGTGLSGGCLAVDGGVIICLTRMNKIIDIDFRNRTAIVEPGVINLLISEKISKNGYLFAPDPSSQQVSTIGGNVAANAGGPHTLKYGSTINHILGVEVVLPDGTIEQFGGKIEDTNGFDITGLMIGSEGTLGIITKIIIKIIHLPEGYETFLAVFETMDDATSTCSEIISSGIIPTAMEIIDDVMINALEKAFKFEFPKDAKAVVVIEIDGIKKGMERIGENITNICTANSAREVKTAKNDEERDLLWLVRKNAFGAIGRIATNYFTNDATVPRTKLPEMLKFINEIAVKYSLTIANTFHAGDGNLHPAVMYDETDADQVERAFRASEEIMKKCVEYGGSISGEHGIGFYKKGFMHWIFSEEDLKFMKNIKKIFDPNRLCNPGKIFE